jgi:hypothetical protein
MAIWLTLPGNIQIASTIQPDYRLLPVWDGIAQYFPPESEASQKQQRQQQREQLLAQAVTGDPIARLRYAEDINYYMLPDRFTDPLAQERIAYLRSGTLDKDATTMAYEQLGRLHGSKVARRFALTLSLDTHRSGEQRRLGLKILSGCLSPGIYKGDKRIPPTQGEVQVFRRFLRSENQADRLAAVNAIQIANAIELNGGLMSQYAREQSLQVRSAILGTFGWLEEQTAFALVLRTSYSTSASLRHSTAESLSLYAAEPNSLQGSQVVALRSRLEQLAHSSDRSEQGKTGLEMLQQAGVKE